MGLQLGWNTKSFNLENWGGTLRTFAAGEYLLKDKSGKYMGILIEGVAKNILTSAEGKERVISFSTPLAIFGEVTMLTGRKFISNLSVQSVTPVKAIYMTKENLEAMVKLDPEAAIFLLRASSEKVSSLISLLNGSYFQDTWRLIVDVLLSLGSNDGEVLLTHEELAEIIGRNRVTVSKTLLKMKKLGLIEQKKKRIMLKDITLLQEANI
jgi:CRP-like cAMP-binding protein